MPRSNKKKKKDGSLVASYIPGIHTSISTKAAEIPHALSSFNNQIPSILLSHGPSIMVQKAIASAARHGIKLKPGRPNPATGNCAFEASIYNVNDRNCFPENLTMSVDYYRRIWTTDMENRSFASPFNPGFSRAEWHEGWNKVAQSNVYEVDYFGDLVVPAIACGLRKNLLIFNTNTENPREPVSVVRPADFNVEISSCPCI